MCAQTNSVILKDMTALLAMCIPHKKRIPALLALFYPSPPL